MKHFFPFLTIILILCLLLHTSPIRSVSAQQHNSFASAKYLSLDHSVSISLPANATEYYYFTSLQPTDQKYQITLSEADSISISAYDDQGSTVQLKQTGTNTSHWTGYIDNISNNARFFLVLQNQTEQDLNISLAVTMFRTATATPQSDSNAKKAATAKPNKKPKSSTNTKKETTQKSKSGQFSTPKAKNTQKPRNVSKQNPYTKTNSPRPKNTFRYNSSSRTGNTSNPRNDSTYSSSVPKTSPTASGYPANTETALPEYTPNNQNTTPEYYSDDSMNHSRSNSILSTHFFRMSAGYSISAFELLSINLSASEIILETLTPEKLSLQNNIIYAKSPGIAVIKIHFGNDITSCTIYIQE